MSLRTFLLALLFLLVFQETQAKSWRGIVPLKSTRADVERLLGKENSRGRYEFADERAYVQYRENPCVGAYRPLEQDNCECFVSRDTVVSIHVTLEVLRTFSSLRLDKTKYQRKLDNLGVFAEYSNWDEGVSYTADESKDTIVEIDYAPSAADCQELMARNLSMYRNSWRRLVPLHSNRTDVERLLGAPAKSSENLYVYETDNEIATVRYSTGVCRPGENEWNVPAGVITEFWVNPIPTVVIRSLRLDPGRFQRRESPTVEGLPKPVTYADEANGVIVRAIIEAGAETVMSITYSPSLKDEKLRCTAAKRTP